MARPGLDFHEHEGGAICRHQIQLAERRPDIPANDLVAQTTEVVLGQRLTANP